MEKTVQIGNKEVHLSNNIGWAIDYRDQFGQDIIPTLLPMVAAALDLIKGLLEEGRKYGLVICPDSSSNDYKFHEQLEEINLKKKGRANVFNLLTRIQDEVHRFVLSFHHQTSQNRQLTSVLDEIPGVGPARRKALMKYFKDIECMKQAKIEELEMVEGITTAVAHNIYDFFHEKPDSGRHDGKTYDKM